MASDDKPGEDNPAFLLRVTPDASTSLGLSARVVFGPTAEQAIERLGVGVHALYPERPTRAQPEAEPVVARYHEALNDLLALTWRDVHDSHAADAALSALAQRLDLPLTLAFADRVRALSRKITPTEKDDE